MESLFSNINKLCDEELFGVVANPENSSKSCSTKDGTLTKEEYKATGNVRTFYFSQLGGYD